MAGATIEFLYVAVEPSLSFALLIVAQEKAFLSRPGRMETAQPPEQRKAQQWKKRCIFLVSRQKNSKVSQCISESVILHLLWSKLIATSFSPNKTCTVSPFRIILEHSLMAKRIIITGKWMLSVFLINGSSKTELEVKAVLQVSILTTLLLTFCSHPASHFHWWPLLVSFHEWLSLPFIFSWELKLKSLFCKRETIASAQHPGKDDCTG